MLTGPMTKRRSNAKTAYDLMSDIRAYILEEPKRVYMGEWLLQGKKAIEAVFETAAPVCGTVGCIAGNAALLTDTPWSTAEVLLGGKNQLLRSRLLALFYDTDVDARYGTKKYARIVAERITKFQKNHRAELQQVRL